jgi:hypothetical protein
MLLTPGLITTTITATRTHRSLVDYASGFPDVYDTFNLLYLYPTQLWKYHFRVTAQENLKLRKSSTIFSKTKRARRADLNSPDRIEVTVHTAFEQHTTTETNDHDSYNSTNEQVHEMPNAWGVHDDVERGM